MKILGINSVYHESSVCLLVDGKIITCVEEERLSRVKHAKHAKIDNPDQLPVLAIEYCLNFGGLNLADIDAIGYSFDPDRRLKSKAEKDYTTPGGWGTDEGENLFFAKLQRVPEQLKAMGFTGKFSWVPHATAHAASAYYPSGFEESGIISIDGIGEVESATLSYANKNEITTIWEAVYPNSVGFLWEKISSYLGYSEYDAGKIMSLGSFGDASKYMSHYRQFVEINDKDLFTMDLDTLKFRVEDYGPLEKVFGVPKRNREDETLPHHQDIAASLQAITTEIMQTLVNHLHKETGSKNLSFAGGVTLNCVANRIVFENGPFENLYVQPATNDGGTSLGAALYLWNQSLTPDTFVAEEINHSYWGPEYTKEEILSVLDSNGIVYSESENVEKEVAQLLSDGKVIGWFQGKMEYGPRALGNRSLLADPRNPEMKARLNELVKHRESYRPFCPSVLEEDAPEWFHIEKTTLASDFMLMAYPVKADLHERVPAGIHVDGTARIQTVKKETNPRFHNLISEFKAITGVPLVINTSFNDREPIVCSPQDAVNTLRKTNIDYLILGDFVIEKAKNPNKVQSEANLEKVS